MADARIEALRRAAAQGDVAARAEQLHLLWRAGRPVGEAWATELTGRVEVELPKEQPAVCEEALRVLAALEPRRAMACLRYALIHKLESRLGNAALELVTGADRSWLRVYIRELGGFGTHAPFARPWQWRVDHRPPVADLVTAPDGSRAAILTRLHDVRCGTTAELVDGRAAWTRAHPAEPVAIGFVGEALVVVEPSRLVVVDGRTGDPRTFEVPFEPVSAAVAPRGEVVLSDGQQLACVDAKDGRVRWVERDPRRHLGADGGERPRVFAAGDTYVAVGGADLALWDLRTGAPAGAIRRVARTVVWEDPDSTMGLARETREVVRKDPSFQRARWAGEVLVTLEWRRSIASWRPGPVVLEEIESHGRLGEDDPPHLAAGLDGAGAYAISDGDDGIVRLWGAGKHEVRTKLRVAALAFARRDLLVVLEDGEILRIDARTGAPRERVRLAPPPGAGPGARASGG